jgi:hypothetical protein
MIETALWSGKTMAGVVAGFALAFAFSSPAQTASLAVVSPVADCTALTNADISNSVGAPVHITSASLIQNARPAPYCRVLGYVEPAVRFEVRLPSATWSQRFVQTGCGGLCGMVNVRLDHAESCVPSQNGELALASTDMGHSGGNDGAFGANDYQLRIDFAYRGVHVTTLAAKALISRYYGQGPKYSYFSGCSDGGREALMEAQRYPEDFNGVAAGAPAINFITQNTFYHGWNARVNTGSDGKPILTADKLPILHKAALDACDAADGLKDGLISNPAACHVDPSVVECKPGAETSGCLTHDQVRVAKELYAGAHDPQGNKFVIGGPMPGSELAWAGVLLPNSGQDRYMSVGISTGALKHLAYARNPPESFTLADFKFDRTSFDATTQLHSLYDATDPDLTPFEAKGGKLILWHGWADPHISPLNTVAYYTAMQRMMGASTVSKFARLYLFPGGYHCGGGEGPLDFDLLTPLMAWVERSVAPEALIAAHSPERGGPGGPAGSGDRMGQPAAKPDRTRPVFPYPSTAKYTGSGSIDEAANFVTGPAQVTPAEALQWLGSGFYSARYQAWCSAKQTVMACQPSRQGK